MFKSHQSATSMLSARPQLLAVALLVGLCWPNNGQAQDLFGLFGSGAETAVSAGAGQLNSRNAAANYYNPANLILTPGIQPYFSLSVINLDYRYTFPFQDTVKIQTTVPVPFLGFAMRPVSSFAFGVSLLPIPGDSGAQEIKGLPTRQFGSDPVIVDAESGGEGLGWRISLGAVYRFLGFNIGLSLTNARSTTVGSLKDATSGQVVGEDTTESDRLAFILGTRGSFAKGMVTTVFTIRPPERIKISGRTALPFLGDDAVIEKNSTQSGPLGFGTGLALRFGTFRPFIEYLREQWGALRSEKTFSGVEEVQQDLFSTNDIIVGANLRFSEHRLTAAAGFYQSHVGEGIMAEFADDGVELAGMDFQKLDGIPYTVFAGGYRYGWGTGHLQTGLQYLYGNRNVWTKSRGAGYYTIDIIQITTGVGLSL